MADEKTSTRALTGRRRMSIPMQPLYAEWDALATQWSLLPDSKNWVPMNGITGFYQEHYFDTSGYTRDDLTTMPVNAYVQEAGRYQVLSPGSIRLVVMDIVMSERIPNVTDMMTQIIATNSGVPSSFNSSYDWTQVQYLRFREFTGITQAGTVQDVFAPTSDQNFGSMEPTTADKLWTYKIVYVVGLPSSDFANIRYPSSRTVLDIDVVKETDLTYLMRQKRSYELTNYE